ncbi:hypothetical protein OG474_40990 [Kribbella sp. NBC_01505]|uniref:hypothetical protein n=1 Tax=Kribbella sp. NBC_01505 TaxID=2903580 RepID=UPI003866A19A
MIQSLIGGTLGLVGTGQGIFGSEVADKLSGMGKGEGYDYAANIVEGLVSILDMAGNLSDVVGLVAAAIAAIAWASAPPTFGGTAPGAAGATSVMTTAGTVSAVLGLAKMALTPVAAVLRALHTFTDTSDPRSVQAKGAQLSNAAKGVGSILGSLAGTKAAGKLADVTPAGRNKKFVANPAGAVRRADPPAMPQVVAVPPAQGLDVHNLAGPIEVGPRVFVSGDTGDLAGPIKVGPEIRPGARSPSTSDLPVPQPVRPGPDAVSPIEVKTAPGRGAASTRTASVDHSTGSGAAPEFGPGGVPWGLPAEDIRSRAQLKSSEIMERKPLGGPSVEDWDATNDGTSAGGLLSKLWTKDDPAAEPATDEAHAHVDGALQSRAGTFVERVNPQYEDPPGTPEQVEAMRAEINQLAAHREIAVQDARDATGDEAKAAGQLSQMATLDTALGNAQVATGAHLSDVSGTTAQNRSQQGRQTEANQKIQESAGSMSGLGGGIAMLGGWESGANMLASVLRMAATVVPSAESWAVKCAQSANDAKSLGAQLGKAQTTVTGLQQQGPQQLNQLKAHEDALTAEARRGAESTAGFEAGKAQLAAKAAEVQDVHATATVNKGKAEADAAEAAEAAQLRQQQHDTLAAELQAWAGRHHEARVRAVHETAARLEAEGYQIVETSA